MIFMHQMISILQSAVAEEWRQVMEAIQSWIDKMSHDILSEGPQSPTPKLERLITEVEYDFIEIYQDLINDGIIPTSESISEFLERPTVSYIIDSYYTIVSSLTEMRRGLENRLHQELRVWLEDIKYVTEGK